MIYQEGNIYTIKGKKQIYQPDGTFRSATINDPPKPINYQLPVVPEQVKTISRTVKNENPSNPGSTVYYNDGTSTFIPVSKNRNGLTTQEMVAKANHQDVSGSGNSTIDTTTVRYNPDGTRKLTGAEKELNDYYNQNKPMSKEDIAAENERIRQEHLAQQKIAIGNINSMYNNILAQVNTQGQSRLGSTAAIDALSGQRGSASGAADVAKTTSYNNSIVQATEAERNAKIAQVMSDYKTQIDNQILEERKLRTRDANAWLKYKGDEVARNKQNSLDLRKRFLAAQLNPTQLDDATYQKIADAGGYSLEQAKALYKNEFEQTQKAYANAEQERLAKLELIKAQTGYQQSKADVNTDENVLIKKGYVYVSTPAQRDALIAKGRTMVQVNGKTYVAPQKLKTKVVKEGNRQFLIDMSTGEKIKDLGIAPTGINTNKNYTATSIPSKVKTDLLYDKNKNHLTVDQLYNLYPDVSTSYIQSLFKKPGQLIF